VQQRAEPLPPLGTEDRPGAVRAGRLALEHRDAPLVERVDGIADRLLVTAQGTGNRGGMLTLGTGQQRLTAADGKGLGRAEALVECVPLVHRERANKEWCLHIQQYSTCPTILLENALDGIGFVLTAADPYVAIDLDGCRDPDAGEIQPWAQAIIDHFRSYTEISPSAAGIRILLNGQLPPGGRKKGAIEVYDSARYVTLTGAHITDTPATIEARQAELDAWHRHVFGEPTTRGEPTSNGHAPASPLSDDAILQKALGARNGDKLARLWGGDLDGYPSHSEVDLALCSTLAFWTSDGAQIDRLFRRSGLCREKWERADYRDMTITKAIESAHEHWGVVSDISYRRDVRDEQPAMLPLKPYAAYRGYRRGVRHG
jgi:hypothetical protein